jgi:hypothetical protein
MATNNNDLNIKISAILDVNKSAENIKQKKQELENKVNQNPMKIKTQIQIFDKEQLKKAGMDFEVNMSGIVERLKRKYKDLGDVNTTVLKNAKGQITQINVEVKKADGIIDNLQYKVAKIKTGSGNQRGMVLFNQKEIDKSVEIMEKVAQKQQSIDKKFAEELKKIKEKQLNDFIDFKNRMRKQKQDELNQAHADALKINEQMKQAIKAKKRLQEKELLDYIRHKLAMRKQKQDELNKAYDEATGINNQRDTTANKMADGAEKAANARIKANQKANDAILKANQEAKAKADKLEMESAEKAVKAEEKKLEAERKYAQKYEAMWLKNLKNQELAEQKTAERIKQIRLNSLKQSTAQQSQQRSVMVQQYSSIGGDRGLNVAGMERFNNYIRQQNEAFKAGRITQDQYLTSMKRLEQQTSRWALADSRLVATVVSNRRTMNNAQQSTQDKIVTFTDKMNTMQQRIAQLQNGRYKSTVNVQEITQLQQRLDTLRQTFERLGTATPEYRQELARIGEGFRNIRQNASEVGRNAFNLTDRIVDSVKRLAIWMGSATILFGTWRQLKNGIQYIYELDGALNQIRIVTGQTQEQVEELAKSYNKLAMSMGVTTSEIAKTSVELFRQGLTGKELNERMDGIIKYAKISGISLGESNKIITATTNALGISAQRTIDVMSYLGRICSVIQ